MKTKLNLTNAQGYGMITFAKDPGNPDPDKGYLISRKNWKKLKAGDTIDVSQELFDQLCQRAPSCFDVVVESFNRGNDKKLDKKKPEPILTEEQEKE
jgi:hypothetical protein